MRLGPGSEEWQKKRASHREIVTAHKRRKGSARPWRTRIPKWIIGSGIKY